MANAQEIQNGRTQDGQDALTYRGLMKAINVAGATTFRNSDGSQTTLNYFVDANNSKLDMQKKAVEKGVALVRGRGFVFPPQISFYLSTSPGVKCVATMGNLQGNSEYCVFMGPKTGQHTPQDKKVTNSGIAGGVGYAHGPKASGAGRGIADQMYDGTQRWFGNPKATASATAVVVHELGHVLHEFQNPAMFWDNKGRICAATLPASTFVAAACDVSQYTATNPSALEFVAEAFAGTVCGKQYPGTVRNAYVACSGPMPNGHWM